ncbi:MAG: hypothetical protein IT366_09950 [Candidatus Hydrogenedentes bacterium]|nr:hypothetical protein [Candidatus Hydrogenedentota bacterium]
MGNDKKKVPLRHTFLSIVALLSCGMLLPQCDPGGFKASDFVKVSQNGFDPVDHEEDVNSYAWAMRYFKADGAQDGHVYVGTGNNIAGLIGFYFTGLIEGGEIDLDEAPARPPEIRRHRPDLGDDVWETVFDYRDVETDGEYKTSGFRFMGTYRAVDADNKGQRSKYLYTATQGLESVLWRSKTGDPGDWQQVFSTGENGASIRYFAEHNGKMYLAYAYDTYEANPPPGEIWVSDDGLNFEPLMQDGFGNPHNRGIEFLISYNNWLYAGTKNDKDGYEIWKLEGPDKGAGAIKLIDGGATDPRNEIAGTPCLFKGQLYIGSIIFFGFNPTQANGFKGCDIIRIDENDDWETVVGPNSISGYDSGFNFFMNAYCWWMEEHDGWLYAGTWDQGTILSWFLDDLPTLIAFIQTGEIPEDVDDLPLEYEQWYKLTQAGADIFKTQDGVNWFPVTIDGMGNRTNYGWRTMESTPDGYLYLGSANPSDGLEIWRGKTEEAKQ